MAKQRLAVALSGGVDSAVTALRDITPGPGVVFYSGDVVLGGGIIER